MTSISATEMKTVKPYLDRPTGWDCSRSAQSGKAIKGAKIQRAARRGGVEAFEADRETHSPTGLMESALESGVNIVNREVVAQDRGLSLSTSTEATAGAFSTLVSATIETADGELTAAGTMVRE